MSDKTDHEARKMYDDAVEVIIMNIYLLNISNILCI